MKAIHPAYDDVRHHYPIIHPDFKRDFTFAFCSGPSILTSHRRPSFRKGMRYAASGTMRPLCCSSESAASAWQTTQRTSAVLSLICWHSVELMYAPSGADRTASRSCSVMFDARKAIHLRESSVQFPYASSKRRLK